MRILIVDDEPRELKSLGIMITRLGHEVIERPTGVDALRISDDELTEVDVAVLDQAMPELDGLETGLALRARHPRLILIMVTAYGSIQYSVQAMREGKFSDYLEKPIDVTLLEGALVRAKNLVESRRLHFEAQAQLLNSYKSKVMIGKAPSFLPVRFLAEKAASANSISVLIRGESGTGKELMARFIHETGKRSDKAFVGVNCAALPENLVEDHLFGHEKGAFTGAVAATTGRFELADGGTLLLDELGDLPLHLQPKLLRALQEHEFEKVGGRTPIRVDVRVISATNQDLEELVKRGEFRQDLLYRLKVLEIVLPPLRERRLDIPILASYFFSIYARAKENLQGIDPAALSALQEYAWPGNIRELESAIERAVTVTDGEFITLSDLPDAIVHGMPSVTNSAQKLKLYFDGLDFERVTIDLVEAMLAQNASSREIGKALSPSTNPTQVFAAFWTQDKIIKVFRVTPPEDSKERWPKVLLDLGANRAKTLVRKAYPKWMIDSL